jgi:hypothetical protein
MPKFVEDLVSELLSKKDFYPEKSEEQQKAIAYAIAYKQLNKMKGKKSKASIEAMRTAATLFSYVRKLEAANHHSHADALFEIVQDLSIEK